MKFTFQIRGLPELIHKFDTIESKFRTKYIRQAIRKGAKPINAEAKSLVPVNSGRLKKSIKTRSLKRSRKTIGVNIKTSCSDNMFTGEVFYGGMVEFGTERMAAQPFMRPAFDNKKRVAERIIIRDLKDVLFREATKKYGSM